MNTILFDLDGTLLPMDTDEFTKIYFTEMAIYLSDLIDGKTLAKNIWASTEAMVRNLDFKTNEEVFMEDFAARIDTDINTYKERFYSFYDTGFLNVKKAVYENNYIQKSVALLKEKGYELVIATNPLFPLKAILHRIRWAGLNASDFIYISSYEKNHYCKPQVKFYEEILNDLGKKASDCMMVGNDVEEDMVAGKLGIKTYLITDNLLQRSEDEANADHKGTYEDFYKFSASLPNLI
ncbi:haloacid dehalogenase [Clostridium zeae]|uniref:Haloacid dehalogenase n=1 Tax=Clostridium zeae TaxID=2759022 RepID=A0ABQ1ECU0_9CLOT|nr:HAD family hydrolase [Clostridium zeae]GFZ32612.1 haloacid dehalogenase [Clostridium zeae]